MGVDFFQPSLSLPNVGVDQACASKWDPTGMELCDPQHLASGVMAGILVIALPWMTFMQGRV